MRGCAMPDNVSGEKPTTKPPPAPAPVRVPTKQTVEVESSLVRRPPPKPQATEGSDVQEASDSEWLLSAIARQQLWELERIRFRLGCLIPIGVVGLILLLVALSTLGEIMWATRAIR